MTYRVAARWAQAAATAVALASSIYVKRGGAWKVELHQQTQVPQP